MSEQYLSNGGAITSPWQLRIEAANKQHGQWEGKFKCKLLEEYYEGFQWKQRRDYPTTNYLPYTINLFYSTIKIKLASLLFQRPKFLITPNPGNSNWNEELAVQSAQLKEDVLNTIVRNPNTQFTTNVKLATLDSFFRFGLIEVGYANDWRNPQKDSPELKSWENVDVPMEDDKVIDENAVPVNERFYVKRIRPSRFRVAVSESTSLEDHDWFGYYEYYYTRDLIHTKGIKWPADNKGGSYISPEYANGFIGNDNDDTWKTLFLSGELSRVWHIWDNVTHERILLLDNDEMSELWRGPCTDRDLISLRWDLRLKGFYPIPPTFQWLSPQDEINEAREQTRSYRRRFTRKFQTVQGMIDEEEKEKFASGPDGILIQVKQLDAIKAIDNPEIGPTSENALVIAKDDFNIISGTSAEARGQDADRETATQAKIVDSRSQIRESAEQLDFSVFLCDVGRALLDQCQKKLVAGLWIKYTQNPGMQQPQNPQVYQYVTSQQIDDGFDYEVEFDVQNATPAAMQASQQSFINFLAILQNPMVLLSPAMIREAAYRVGYRNEAIIKEAQQAALAHAQMQMVQQAQAGQQGNNPQNVAKTRQAQMATPSAGGIGDQLNSQLQ